MTTRATPRATRCSNSMQAYPCRGPKAAAPLEEPPLISGPDRARLGVPAPPGKEEAGKPNAERGDRGGLRDIGRRVRPEPGEAELAGVHLALERNVDQELVVRVELRSDRRGEVDFLGVDGEIGNPEDVRRDVLEERVLLVDRTGALEEDEVELVGDRRRVAGVGGGQEARVEDPAVLPYAVRYRPGDGVRVAAGERVVVDAARGKGSRPRDGDGMRRGGDQCARERQ